MKAPGGTILSRFSFRLKLCRLGMEGKLEVGILYSLLALRSSSTRLRSPVKACNIIERSERVEKSERSYRVERSKKSERSENSEEKS